VLTGNRNTCDRDDARPGMRAARCSGFF